jgi:hypothetical protein
MEGILIQIYHLKVTFDRKFVFWLSKLETIYVIYSSNRLNCDFHSLYLALRFCKKNMGKYINVYQMAIKVLSYAAAICLKVAHVNVYEN